MKKIRQLLRYIIPSSISELVQFIRRKMLKSRALVSASSRLVWHHNSIRTSRVHCVTKSSVSYLAPNTPVRAGMGLVWWHTRREHHHGNEFCRLFCEESCDSRSPRWELRVRARPARRRLACALDRRAQYFDPTTSGAPWFDDDEEPTSPRKRQW